MGDTIKGYLCLGNSWGQIIKNITFWHQKANDPRTEGHEPSLNAGAVSEVVSFIAEDGVHDNWGVEFTDKDNVTWHAEFDNEGFKDEDANGIVFMNVTKDDKEAHLYFPVSSDADEDLKN
jgi:hypothetical protein